MMRDFPIPRRSLMALMALNFSTIGRTCPGLQKKISRINSISSSFSLYPIGVKPV